MVALRVLLALIVLSALLVRPSLWPFAAAGLLATLLVSLVASARPELRTAVVRATTKVVVMIAGAIAVLGVLALVLTADRSGKGGPVDPGAPPLPCCAFVDATYAARLTLTDTRDLRTYELLTLEPDMDGLPHAPSFARAVTRAIARDGWRPSSEIGTSTFVRSATRRLDVPGILPSERTNRLDLPDTLLRLQGTPQTRLRLTLGERSAIVLDAPSNAIGNTFPAGTTGPGPRHSTRTTLPLPDFEDAVEFDVRSRPFRNPILVKAVNVTVWTPFGWLLALAIPLISDRARGIAWDLIRRGLRRLRPGRRGERRTQARDTA